MPQAEFRHRNRFPFEVRTSSDDLDFDSDDAMLVGYTDEGAIVMAMHPRIARLVCDALLRSYPSDTGFKEDAQDVEEAIEAMSRAAKDSDQS